MKRTTSRKASKNALNALLVFFCCLFLALPAWGHPPSDVALDYDREERVLTVSITHSVGDPMGHYVSQVTLTVQGRPFKAFTYTSQPDRTAFVYTYELDAASGDVLSVIAGCNRFGSRSASITVP